MTGRERILQAFSSEGTDAFGAVMAYPGIFFRDHAMDFSQHPWWYEVSPDVEQQLARTCEIVAGAGLDWMQLYHTAPREERRHLALEEEGDAVYLVDGRTGERNRVDPPCPGGNNCSRDVVFDLDALPTTEEALDTLFPVAEALDPKAFAEAGSLDLQLRQIQALPEVCPMGHTQSPLWMTYGQWGFEGLMMMAAAEPELLNRAGERCLQNAINRVLCLGAAGCDLVWIEECLMDQVSPEFYTEFNLPFVRQLCDVIRGEGMKSVYYYCGNPWDRLESILATGCDAISLEESKKDFAIDIEEVVEAVDGRAVVLGNIDAFGVLE
ncbi:MAG: uroporphyrinogen decarboxylase family protein [Planctomycetota bacterium]|jgi:hypothetical protein